MRWCIVCEVDISHLHPNAKMCSNACRGVRVQEKNRNWCRKNLEKARENRHNWRRKNLEKARENQRNRDRKQRLITSILAELGLITAQQKKHKKYVKIARELNLI